MKKLAIIGAGDLGFQIAYHALNDNHYNPVGFFDDKFEKGTIVNNLPILGNLDAIEQSYCDNSFDFLIIGIGYQHLGLRETLFDKFYNKVPFGNMIHSSAYIDKSCEIGKGVVIYPGCLLDMKVHISNNVLINVGSVIAHDTIIQSHSFLAPSTRLAGYINIGKKVNLGIGSTVIDNISICNNVRTGGGTVVTKNISIPGLYVGAPARFIR